MSANAAHKIHILHQRERAKTPDLIVKAARNEQPLIAVGQGEQPHPHRDSALDDPGLPSMIVKAQVEMSGASGSGRDMRCNGFAPARGEQGIGVKEQKPVAARRLTACAQLRSAPSRCGKDMGSHSFGDGRAVIGRAAIDDDDFVGAIECRETGQVAA